MNSWVHGFLQMIDGANPVAMFLLTIALLFLGDAAARSCPLAYRLGNYAAAFASSLYVLYAILAYGRMEPLCLLGILWRALLAAGVAYGAVALASAVGSALVAPPHKTASTWLNRSLRKIANWFDDRRLRKLRMADAVAATERERQLAPVREQARLVELEAARRRDELTCVRDQLRYDLRLEFKQLRKYARDILTDSELESQLDHALAPADTAEIERRVTALRAVFAAVHNTMPRPRTFESLTQDFVERHAAIDRSAFDDRLKVKFHRWLNLQAEHELQQFFGIKKRI